jgi:hypothetical protein
MAALPAKPPPTTPGGYVDVETKRRNVETMEANTEKPTGFVEKPAQFSATERSRMTQRCFFAENLLPNAENYEIYAEKSW